VTGIPPAHYKRLQCSRGAPPQLHVQPTLASCVETNDIKIVFNNGLFYHFLRSQFSNLSESLQVLMGLPALCRSHQLVLTLTSLLPAMCWFPHLPLSQSALDLSQLTPLPTSAQCAPLHPFPIGTPLPYGAGQHGEVYPHRIFHSKERGCCPKDVHYGQLICFLASQRR
jgi:hypothetical protein